LGAVKTIYFPAGVGATDAIDAEYPWLSGRTKGERAVRGR
jgi:hypothetical protein